MPAAAERIARSHRYFEPVAGGMKRSVSEAQSELSGLFLAFHATGLEQPGRRRNRYEKGKTPIETITDNCLDIHPSLRHSVAFRSGQSPQFGP